MFRVRLRVRVRGLELGLRLGLGVLDALFLDALFLLHQWCPSILASAPHWSPNVRRRGKEEREDSFSSKTRQCQSRTKTKQDTRKTRLYKIKAKVT